MWADTVGSLAVAATVFAIASMVGRWLAPRAARRAVQEQGALLLKVSSFASQLLWWAGFAVVLEWIVVLVLKTGLLRDQVAAFVASGILLVVPVTIALTQGEKFWDAYWYRISNILDEAIPKQGPQRQTYNEQHEFLLTGSRSDRNAILRKIIKPKGPTRTKMP